MLRFSPEASTNERSFCWDIKKTLLIEIISINFDDTSTISCTWRILRACSYGQKLSRLPRKHFDKFTSEISPCYKIIWKVALRWSHMITTFPLSRKTLCLHFTKSTSQRETLPGKRVNVVSATVMTSTHMNRPSRFVHASKSRAKNRPFRHDFIL